MSVTCDRSVVFSVSSTNKTDCHDITEIWLKVALNTIKQTNKQVLKKTLSWCIKMTIRVDYNSSYLHYNRNCSISDFNTLVSCKQWQTNILQCSVYHRHLYCTFLDVAIFMTKKNNRQIKYYFSFRLSRIVIICFLVWAGL